MSVPRENATPAQRLKSLEQEVARLTLQASQTVATAAPTDVMPRSTWIDPSANNAPYFLDDTGTWVSTRDGNIAVAQATANSALGAATTDGLPPASSPACEMVGGVGAILFRWTPITNPNTVTYKIYLSTTAGFTADTTTLVGVTAASQLTVRNLNGGVPLAYGTTYYGKVIATDADGPGPVGAETFAQMVQVTTPDVSAAYVYAGNIVVDQLAGGTLSADIVMGSTIRTALTGQRVEIGPLGIITYDSSGVSQTVLPSGTGQSNIFKGLIEAAGVTATGAISMRSVDNEIIRGAALTLNAGVTASKSSPSVVVDWETANLDTVTAFGVDATTLGPTHALAMCGIGTRFLVAFKGASSWGYATFNPDGTYYSAGPQKYVVGTSTINQIACNGLTKAVYIQESGRNLTRFPWTGSRTFYDDFSGTLAAWSTTSNTAIASGVARITTPAVGNGSMFSPNSSMQEKTLSAKITPRFSSPGVLASQTWSIKAQADVSNYLEIALNPSGVAAGNLRFRYTIGGVSNDTTLAHDPVNYQYFRIEHSATLINFYTSPDGATWTNRKSISHGFTTTQLDTMHIEIVAAATGTALELDIDNVEINWTQRTLPISAGGSTEIPAIGASYDGLLIRSQINTATPPAFVIDYIDERTMLSSPGVTTQAVTGFQGQLSGVCYTQDPAWGTATKWVMASKVAGATVYWVVDFTSNLYEGTNAFAVPTGGSKGIAHDGTQFWSLNASGQLAKHTGNTWTSSGDPENWWSAFTWFDSNATGGTHETPMSGQANFAMHKRARYTITTPAIPAGLATTDDIDTVRLYIGRGAGVPARTAMWLQGTSAVNSNTMTFTTGTFSGTNPPAANNFPTSAAAGKIRNSDDSLVISGDGSTKTKALTIGTTQVWAPQYVRKPSAQTLLNQSSSVNDTALQFTADINAVYWVQVLLVVSEDVANATADFQVGFVMPAGADWTGFGSGPDPSIAASGANSSPASGNWKGLVGSGGTTLKFGVDPTINTPIGILIAATMNIGATGGTIPVKWAQLAAQPGVTTTVHPGSFLSAIRVA